MSNSIRKQAQKDATEYAGAHMAYGEGAGNRRKLIEGTVQYKAEFIPGYREEFEKAHSEQNMAEHAKNAKTTNRRKQANAVVTRNTKAVLTGKYENVNTGLLLVGAIGVVLHKTGYDKKLAEVSKRKYKELRQRFRKTTVPKPSRSKGSGDDKVHNITNIR